MLFRVAHVFLKPLPVRLHALIPGSPPQYGIPTWKFWLSLNMIQVAHEEHEPRRDSLLNLNAFLDDVAITLGIILALLAKAP